MGFKVSHSNRTHLLVFVALLFTSELNINQTGHLDDCSKCTDTNATRDGGQHCSFHSLMMLMWMKRWLLQHVDKYQNSWFYFDCIKVINTSGSGFSHHHSDMGMDESPKAYYSTVITMSLSLLLAETNKNDQKTGGFSTNLSRPNHGLNVMAWQLALNQGFRVVISNWWISFAAWKIC